MLLVLQPIVIVAAFLFASVGFYSLSPDVLDTEFCCDGNHNLEGKELCKLNNGHLVSVLHAVLHFPERSTRLQSHFVHVPCIHF